MSDAEHIAAGIRSAVRTLNELLAQAATMGLSVEISGAEAYLDEATELFVTHISREEIL
jgi:hypothetical protein